MEKKTPPATPARKSPPVPPKKPIATEPIPTDNPNVEIDRATNRPKFVAGNQLWKLAKGGRRAIITDAAELWQKAVNYFEWCDANPQNKVERSEEHTSELHHVEISYAVFCLKKKKKNKKKQETKKKTKTKKKKK